MQEQDTDTAAVLQFASHRVEKPWGRNDLRAPFDNLSHDRHTRIGEVWYQSDDAHDDDPLLIKYLFTSEKLSVQVHPDDAAGQARGHKSGKAECWYVVDASPDAVLGLGLRQTLDHDDLRAKSLSGEIEHLIDWKPTKAGDLWYVKPGTIHAIGGGLTLIEVQQNIDLTYRLYDYGRPRELHLDDGVAVATPEPYDMANHWHYDGAAPFLHQWAHFGMALCNNADQIAAALQKGRQDSYWLPVDGSCTLDGITMTPGNVYRIARDISVDGVEMQSGTTVLISWANKAG